jgi:hypothetical protein
MNNKHELFVYSAECVLYAVGKPVYIKYTEQNYGSWLKDSAAKNDVQAEKIWSTRENDDFQLFEYANKVEAYRNNVASKVYRLQFPFKVIQLWFVLDILFPKNNTI